MTPYCFFAHVAFGFDARSHATPQATANLLIEVDDETLKSASKERHLKARALQDPHTAELASEIAMAAAREYLKSQPEFRPFPAQRFVNFELARPTHISIQPAPTKVLPNGVKVWRFAQSE